MGRDAAHTSLKRILPGSENKKGANGQHKGREGPNARAGEHNDQPFSNDVVSWGASATTRRQFKMFRRTQLHITFRRAAAVIRR